MNVEHKPKDQFERNAVEMLATGKKEFESAGELKFRGAAPLVLHNARLKCHVPNRKTLEERVAGFVISMPFLKKRTALALATDAQSESGQSEEQCPRGFGNGCSNRC